MENTGSFGSAIGGMSPELAEAMQRRGGQGNPMAQVSNSAPTANPAIQAPSPLPSPQGSPAGALGGAPLPEQTPESQIIIKALDGRLKSLSKLTEMTGGQKGL